MYDTVAGLFREVPPKVIDRIPWTGSSRSFDRSTGEVRESLLARNPGGVVLMLHPDGTLKWERSLPKALTGQNAEDLTQADVPDALAVVDAEVEAQAGPGLPSVADTVPCRVDYCRSFQLEDPALVDLALERWARMRVARKGLPVRGADGSVSWPRGEYRPKGYNKGREDGDPDHLSVFRFEVGAFGHRALAKIPGLLPIGVVGPDGPPKLRVVDVLRPEASEHVIHKVLKAMGGVPVNGDDLGDVEFVRELMSFFGPRRGSAILGYCTVWAMTGVRGPADLPGDATTWYRVVADLRRFRDHLTELGRTPEAAEDLPMWLVASARLVA